MVKFPVFKNRLELRAWLQDQDNEIIKDYCKDVLLRRKSDKNIIYTLSQVELRSLPEIPNINYYDSVFGDYYKLCEELGFINKYRVKTDSFMQGVVRNETVIVDSREKTPIKFNSNIKTKVEGLKYGDYALEGSMSVCLERKSLPDLLGTISAQYDRFQRELDRAREANSTLFIIVEESFQHALAFNKLYWITKFTKVQPSFIWHRIRELIQKYPNIQFLFVPGGRSEVARIALKLLHYGGSLKNYDCQFLLEKSLL